MFILLLSVLSEKLKIIVRQAISNENHEWGYSCVEYITELCYFCICIQEIVEFHL